VASSDSNLNIGSDMPRSSKPISENIAERRMVATDLILEHIKFVKILA